MSRYYHFKASEFDKWIDTDEVCMVQSPLLMNECRFKWMGGVHLIGEYCSILNLVYMIIWMFGLKT